MITAISGINGKMGNEIYKEAKLCKHSVICGVDVKPVGEFDCPVYKNFEEIRSICDVIIDFSSPANLSSLLLFATGNAIPVVIGTTGYSDEQENQILSASEIIPVFKSDNFSPGIFAIQKAIREIVKYVSDYDIEITETHHNKKIDSPSGTAKQIIKTIRNSLNKEMNLKYGRIGKEKRQPDEIGVHSLRGGGVTGIHEVTFFGEKEYLSIKHVALDKSVFAEGAIKAAEFIISQPRGLYNFDNLFNYVNNNQETH